MTTQNKKVIIIERVFAVYRKPVYDLISQQTDLKVLYGKSKSGIKTAETTYAEQIPSYQYGKNDSNVLLFPLWKIIKFRPHMVTLDFALGVLNLPIIILACKLLGVKVVFWSHGYDRKTGFHPESKRADKYRLFLSRLVDANIVYGQMDKNLLQKYLDKDHIFVAQNTLDTNTLSNIKERLEQEGKDRIKERLGIRHEVNITYIGRMLPSKRPDLLVDIYNLLKTAYGITAGIHFIGNGELLPTIKERVQAEFPAEDFYFHGAIHDNEKTGELLYVSDIMVMPGGMGLSVNHAFCFDCPVLTFKRENGFPAHGPEIEYVVHQKTGFLIEEHTPEAVATALSQFIKNTTLKEEIRNNIQFAVRNVFPLEKMVEGVMECVNYLSNGTQKETLG